MHQMRQRKKATEILGFLLSCRRNRINKLTAPPFIDHSSLAGGFEGADMHVRFSVSPGL